VSVTVLKVWNDASDTDERPASVTAELLKNGADAGTAVLSAQNNWRYTWTGLSDSYTWTVLEKDVPKDYTVTYSSDGAVRVITNTLTPNIPDTPTPGTNIPTTPTPSPATNIPGRTHAGGRQAASDGSALVAGTGACGLRPGAVRDWVGQEGTGMTKKSKTARTLMLLGCLLLCAAAALTAYNVVSEARADTMSRRKRWKR
jgi:hypothetical protein